ncbi:MAG: PKD domain-containing protein [Anaerolineales bacterium]
MPAGEGDLQILDLSDPIHPEVIGHIKVDFNWVAAIYGDYVYISRGRSSLGVSAIDISDPAQPVWASQNVWPRYANRMIVEFDEALNKPLMYVAGAQPGFYVLDMTDPLNLVEIGSVDIGDNGVDLFLSGDRAYVSLDTALGLLDPAIAYGPKNAGFAMIDISAPTNPTLMATYLGDPQQVSGLLAYYPFEGNANDASGNGHHGAEQNEVSYSPAREGMGVSLDGVDDYLWFPLDIREQTHPQLTIGAWLKPSSLPSDNRAWPIIYNNSTSRGLQLDNRYGCRGFPCWLAIKNNFSYDKGSGEGVLASEDEWVFLAVVYDTLSEINTLYVGDRVFQVSQPSSEEVDHDFFLLGSSGWTLDGIVDDLFIFGNALDESQIDEIRENGRQAIETLAATLPITYQGELDPARLRRLIGATSDLAIMTQNWIPHNYPRTQAGKLILVDVADPMNIYQIGEYSFQNDVYPELRIDLFSSNVQGNFIYITDDSQDSTQDSLNNQPWLTDDPLDFFNYRMRYEDYTSLLTFDITDPALPQLVDRYDHPHPSRFRHMTLHEGLLYINDYNYGVRVFDTSDPAKPILASGTLTAAEGHYAWVNDVETHAFMSQTFGGTIYALDIRNPSSPIKVGSFWDGEWSEKSEFTGRGDFLYVPTAFGVNIIDASDPSQMAKIGTFPETYHVSVVNTFEEYAFVLTANSHAGSAHDAQQYLRVYDISNPAAPVLLNGANPVDLGSRHMEVYAQGNLVYVTAPGSLKIFDVTNPAVPALIGELTDARLQVSTLNYPKPMRVRNGYAYITNGMRNNEMFYIVDVHDSSNPQFIKAQTYSQNRHMTDMHIEGRYLWVGTYWGNYMLYDLANPVDPTLLGDGGGLGLGNWNASWSLGGFAGENLVIPSIDTLNLVNVPHESQGLIGPITVSANLNREPIADAGGLYSGVEGSIITFDASASSDPDGDTLQYRWDLDGDGAWERDWSDAPTLGWTWDDDFAATGVLEVTDGLAVASVEFSIEVLNASPIVSLGEGIAISEGDTLIAGGSFADPGADEWTATVNYGDGPEALTLEGFGFSLEHDYADNEDVAIEVCVTDDDGGIGCGILPLAVVNLPPAIGDIVAPLDPIEVGMPIEVMAPFTDPGVQDTHEAWWDWGDESGDAGTTSDYTAFGSHTYTTPGVYVITLTLTDDDGGMAVADFHYLVVYDPEGGFVTGGGWIVSPEGAYGADPLLTGRANFGFVSKYKKGADVPIGQTDFHFRVADLHFHSDSYEWLVVARARAQFKGVGTINGEGEYKFMLVGIDADVNENDVHDVDGFRIRIWTEDEFGLEHVVYDNQPDEDLDSDATTDIGGGSIVIHK